MRKITVQCGTEFDKDGIPIDSADRTYFARLIRDFAVERFSGVTFTDTLGSWKNDKGEIVSESGWQIVVLTDNAVLSATLFADVVKRYLKQSSVILIVEDVDAKFV